MTTLSPPIQHSTTQPDLGFDYVFSTQQLLERLTDRDKLDVAAPGVVSLVGDAAGTGSDVIRVTNLGGVGYGATATDLTSETDTVAPSDLVTGFSTVAIADAGYSLQDTMKQNILARDGNQLMNIALAAIPDVWRRKLRLRVTNTIAGFSNVVGSSGSPASVDNLLDILAAFEEQNSAFDTGNVQCILKNQQMTQLRNSMRSEPAFQNSMMEFAAVQGDRRRMYQSFGGMPIDIMITNDVETAGGAYQGGVYHRGGIGWARASTTRLADLQGMEIIGVVPEFGIVVFANYGQNGQTIRTIEARFYFGVAAGSPDVFYQTRWISDAS